MIDTCAFCGTQYHPMPVYTREQPEPDRPKARRIHAGRTALQNFWLQDWPESVKEMEVTSIELTEEEEKLAELPPIIYVCHYRWDAETNKLNLYWQACRKKAEELGYVYRPFLTPTR